jgi:septal ring factor EnvC (AmiA/AmiB activator)
MFHSVTKKDEKKKLLSRLLDAEVLKTLSRVQDQRRELLDAIQELTEAQDKIRATLVQDMGQRNIPETYVARQMKQLEHLQKRTVRLQGFLAGRIDLNNASCKHIM